VPTNPQSEYKQRLAERRANSDRLDARHRMMGNLKLLDVALALLILWLLPGWWWLALPAAAFIILLIVHERILRALRNSRRAEAFYQRGLDRIDDCWSGTGETGARFENPSHPYASDLDLFGNGSLFQLLSSCRTRAGEDTLARWLMGPGDVNQVRARQEAVAELRHKLDLREDLALLGEDAGSGVHAAELAAWATQPPILASRRARFIAPLLVGLVLAALSGWFWLGWPLSIVAVALIIEAAFSLPLRARVSKVAAAVDEASHDLDLLAQVLVRLEREQFTSPRLRELRAALDTGGLPASRRIAQLDRLVELLDSRDHLVMRVVGPLLLWTTQLALAIEAWRLRHGTSVPRWLDAVGEMEALSSLAAYSYEHSADPFPEFTSESGPFFHGEALAHPLLPAARAVRNDVQLDRGRALLLVSGSNMSGKSTLLRTVGVNTVLALAGAPVRARRLIIGPMSTGSSIRIHDSLQAGTSRFYAEVLRIRQIVQLAERGPLLFLLDELLHGTNSHDRRIGAGAILRSLLERDAIGLATTHDLALSDIVQELAPRAENVHFQDEIRDGQITFDYLMRAGVVTKSNALELMRSVGLDV
jgi:hypothetical protein